MDGNLAGYSRVWWWDEAVRQAHLLHFSFLRPEWRETGIRLTMLRHSEQRLREIAVEHQTDLLRFYESWASDTETQWEALLAAEGYEGVRHGFDMVRPNLENIPDLPLPQGLEVRLTQPDQYRTVWEGAREAFRDEWGYFEEEWSDQRFESWKQEATFDPSLWRLPGMGTKWPEWS